MKLHRAIVAYAILISTTSCVHYSPRLEPTFMPDQKTVVLYGRFKDKDNMSSKDKSFWGYDMALRVFNEDTRKMLFIRFSKTDPVLCVSVESGHYRIVGYGVTDGYDKFDLVGSFRTNEPFTASFHADRDSAIYLGDFSGNTKFSVSFTVMTLKAEITEATNNYLETTKLFHDKYPHLASMPIRSIFRPFAESDLTPAPNNSPEPTAVGAAVAIHAASRRWLSFGR
jgi:hypothetical protein